MDAFVLSGGGNLGSIQVGMVQALAEAGVTPGTLVGTSIGAVNAAVLAADPSPEGVARLRQLWTSVRSRDVFPFRPWQMGRALLRQGSLFPAEAWRRVVEAAIPYRRIEDAAVPLRITATDFEDGRPILFDSGPVVDAVLASTALPLVFPPHRIGDRHYLDGALSDQVPLKAAVDAGAKTIYVLAVSFPAPPPELHSPRGILRHSITILLFPRIRLDALGLPGAESDLRVVQVPSVPSQVALWDFSRNTELIETAYENTRRFLADRDQADVPHEQRTRVETVPEMTVEVDVQEPSMSETRSTEDSGDDAP